MPFRVHQHSIQSSDSQQRPRRINIIKSATSEIPLPSIPDAVSLPVFAFGYNEFFPFAIEAGTDDNNAMVTGPANDALCDSPPFFPLFLGAVSIISGFALAHLECCRGEGIGVGEDSREEWYFAQYAPFLFIVFGT